MAKWEPYLLSAKKYIFYCLTDINPYWALQDTVPPEQLSRFRSESPLAAVRMTELRRAMATCPEVVCRAYASPNEMAFMALDDILGMIIDVAQIFLRLLTAPRIFPTMAYLTTPLIASGTSTRRTPLPGLASTSSCPPRRPSWR
jgi:hypothetical protein